MEKLTLIGLGLSGTGIVASKYFDNQARKTTGDEQISNAKMSKNTSLLIPVGLAVSTYSALLKNHPTRTAIALIPIGLGIKFVTAFGFDADFSNTPKGIIGNAVGLGTSIGGLTYLLSKNTKTSLLLGVATAAYLYFTKTKDAESAKTSAPIKNATGGLKKKCKNGRVPQIIPCFVAPCPVKCVKP
jgi:uncharacterized membrane protein YidH (DUF202 family)